MVFRLVMLSVALSLLLVGCISHPVSYVGDVQPRSTVYRAEVNVSSISADEYALLTAKLANKSSFNLVSNQFDADSAHLVFELTGLGQIDQLVRELREVSAVYTVGGTLTPLLTPTQWLRQYNFKRNTAAASRAQYVISVAFDPRTQVTIGGWSTFTDENGKASFNGSSLLLSQAKAGIISITDNLGSLVKVERTSDGLWVVKAVGNSNGKTAEKLIPVEALQ